jgi:hypothetical protein
MRFRVNKNGEWRMGCNLVSPATGATKYHPDLLRYTTLDDATRAVVEAHLLQHCASYTGLTTKKDVQAMFEEWVQEQRANDPDFWSARNRRGPKKLDKDTPAEVREVYQERMRQARESGRQWAGNKFKQLTAAGHARSGAMVDKPYIPRLLAAHERLLPDNAAGGEVHPSRAKGKGARIVRVLLPEHQEVQRQVSKETGDGTPLVELLTPAEVRALAASKKWSAQR